MEYIIRKTSTIFNEEKPCDEAYNIEVTSYDYRSCKTLSEARNKHWFKSWYNNTTDHVELKNCIRGTRKEKEKCFAIQITSLEELNHFKEEHGDIIITSPYFNHDLLMIEIYDDYRE